MSNLKCPFCNGELVGTIGHPTCRNQDCVMCDDPMPQDLLEELILTRKALEIATKANDEIRGEYEMHRGAEREEAFTINWDVVAKKMYNYANNALEQIEHKEK